jgi:hypothetical protein
VQFCRRYNLYPNIVMKRFAGGVIFLIILCAILFVPVEIPFDASSIGKILPAQEWKLLQDQTGHLSSVVWDYRSGVVREMGAYQFQSGDFSGFESSVPVSDTSIFIASGDTIVRMYSALQKQELQDLNAEIALYSAQLQAEKTGEKNPIIQEAENKLFFARQDLTLKQKNYDIQKSLYTDGVIAKTEFIKTENDYELAKIQVGIAEKNVETAQTGLKSESLDITKNRIESLKKSVALLRQRGLKLMIRAPFSGYVSPVLLPGEMLTLQSAGEYVVHIPLKVEHLPYLNQQTTIEVTDAQSGKTYPARFLQIAPKVEVLDNKQVVVLLASLSLGNEHLRLSTGISGACTVHFGRVNQREYLKRLLNFSLLKK